ncbi:MAG: hypothetical protein KatS3mg108_2555 [Isosphaeraceae bacterium]|jgi:hypothetical protein|nr:MAG: hypothetical protein KatS3mg108_2555 [Isosphaeraceae bacterium]
MGFFPSPPPGCGSYDPGPMQGTLDIRLAVGLLLIPFTALIVGIVLTLLQNRREQREWLAKLQRLERGEDR